MLIILILLLMFTDFELSGQNIDSEAKFKELNFWYILEFICYIACVTYVYRLSTYAILYQATYFKREGGGVATDPFHPSPPLATGLERSHF